MKLKTSYEGRELLHRHLWEIVEEQAGIAAEREREWFRPTLVAMVFAFHTVEAYLNYVGEKLAPDIWADERNYFRKESYRGWEGKLRKVLELVGIAWTPDERPLKTTLELRDLRDLIAHGKSERLQGELLHDSIDENLMPISTIRGMATPKDKLPTMLPDVKQFVNEIHRIAATKIEHDIWFGSEALRGPKSYSARSTEIAS